MKNRDFSFNAVDWLADSGLSQVSPSARGIWIDLLCRMWLSDNPGHLVLDVDGVAPTLPEVAKACRASVSETRDCLKELERYGVISRTPEGVIFSARMVRESAPRAKAIKTGRMGGKPRLNSKR